MEDLDIIIEYGNFSISLSQTPACEERTSPQSIRKTEDQSTSASSLLAFLSENQDAFHDRLCLVIQEIQGGSDTKRIDDKPVLSFDI